MSQHKNAMNPPPLPEQGLLLDWFPEEADTLDDPNRQTLPDIVNIPEASPTERTPIPPPEEPLDTSNGITLRSPPPDKIEESDEEKLLQAWVNSQRQNLPQHSEFHLEPRRLRFLY